MAGVDALLDFYMSRAMRGYKNENKEIRREDGEGMTLDDGTSFLVFVVVVRLVLLNPFYNSSEESAGDALFDPLSSSADAVFNAWANSSISDDSRLANESVDPADSLDDSLGLFERSNIGGMSIGKSVAAARLSSGTAAQRSKRSDRSSPAVTKLVSPGSMKGWDAN